jgi:predicted MFS family arabinose efflux permease
MRNAPRTAPAGVETFAALAHPNYRLWFIGQMVSLFGTWMQTAAQGYLVFQLTHSAAFLGYVGFAAGVPVWLFTLFGGVLADRLPRRRLLILTQSYMMLLALALAALTFSRLVRPWHIVVLAFLLGAGNAFDAPARQSFVLEMVDRKTLSNAIALNSAMFNTAIAVGPAIGGLTYAAFGPGWCFTLNALSFLAVIAALAAMRLAPHRPPAGGGSALGELRQGIAYVAAHPQIRILLAIVASTSLFGMSFATLVPAWAVRILHGDARTNGLLLTARGIGSLATALFLATFASRLARGRALAVGLAVFPAALLAFAFLRRLGPAMLLLVVAGAGAILIYNTANALVQTLADDPLRGRVMGLYSLCLMGLMPVGSLLAGTVAEHIGEPGAVMLGAGIMLACALAVWTLFPRLRDLR